MQTPRTETRNLKRNNTQEKTIAADALQSLKKIFFNRKISNTLKAANRVSVEILKVAQHETTFNLPWPSSCGERSSERERIHLKSCLSHCLPINLFLVIYVVVINTLIQCSKKLRLLLFLKYFFYRNVP